MKNAELKVVRFNAEDVIAASMHHGATYSTGGQEILDASDGALSWYSADKYYTFDYDQSQGWGFSDVNNPEGTDTLDNTNPYAWFDYNTTTWYSNNNPYTGTETPNSDKP